MTKQLRAICLATLSLAMILLHQNCSGSMYLKDQAFISIPSTASEDNGGSGLSLDGDSTTGTTTTVSIAATPTPVPGTSPAPGASPAPAGKRIGLPIRIYAGKLGLYDIIPYRVTGITSLGELQLSGLALDTVFGDKVDFKNLADQTAIVSFDIVINVKNDTAQVSQDFRVTMKHIPTVASYPTERFHTLDVSVRGSYKDCYTVGINLKIAPAGIILFDNLVGTKQFCPGP